MDLNNGNFIIKRQLIFTQSGFNSLINKVCSVTQMTAKNKQIINRGTTFAEIGQPKSEMGTVAFGVRVGGL